MILSLNSRLANGFTLEIQNEDGCAWRYLLVYGQNLNLNLRFGMKTVAKADIYWIMATI